MDGQMDEWTNYLMDVEQKNRWEIIKQKDGWIDY